MARGHGPGHSWGGSPGFKSSDSTHLSVWSGALFKPLPPSRPAAANVSLCTQQRGSRPGHSLGPKPRGPCSLHPIQRVLQEGPSLWEGTLVLRGRPGPGGSPGTLHDWRWPGIHAWCVRPSRILSSASHGLCLGPWNGVYHAPRAHVSPLKDMPEHGQNSSLPVLSSFCCPRLCLWSLGPPFLPAMMLGPGVREVRAQGGLWGESRWVMTGRAAVTQN